jgi:hypothetical protein
MVVQREMSPKAVSATTLILLSCLRAPANCLPLPTHVKAIAISLYVINDLRVSVSALTAHCSLLTAHYSLLTFLYAQREALLDEPAGAAYGYIRIRYSVKWVSEWRRISRYLGVTSPQFVRIPLRTRADAARVEFTVNGIAPDRKYCWSTLKHHFDELLSIRQAWVSFKRGAQMPRCPDAQMHRCIDAPMHSAHVAGVEDIIFYRHPVMSIVCAALWQFAILHRLVALAVIPAGLG